jgi:hypothetical protein
MMDKLDETAGSQETQVGNKERTTSDRRQMVRLSVGAAVGFLIATIALGYLIGRINSPKWENRVVVGKFVADHYRGKFLAEGRPESDPIELRLRLGDIDLVYRTDTKEIQEVAVPIEEVHAERSKDNQTLIQSAFIVAAPLAAPLSNVHVSLGNKVEVVAVVTVVGAAVVGAGGLLGYSWGFDPDPDYSSKPFQEMRSNKARWRQLAEDYRTKTSRASNRAAPSATP